MVSQASKRAWRRVAAGLFLLPAMAGGGYALWAQGPAAVRPAADKATAANYLVKGRSALMAGDLAAARQYALAAQQYSGKWEFWQEDTPEKLLGDIGGNSSQPMTVMPARATESAPTLVPVAATSEEKAVLPSDPRQLVKLGRDYIRAGRLDLAEECAKRAAASSTRWGLFELTPEKLKSQIESAKVEKNRADAEKALVDARKHYQQGDYDKALELAQKADKLHGPYAWEMGDRPSKLMAEIEAAKGRQRKSTPAATLPGSVASAAKPVELEKPPELKGIPAGPVASSRTKAHALMTECRSLEKANRLIEARGKAMEAQALNAEWAAGEDRPETALMDLNQTAASQINSYADQAMKLAGPAPTADKAAQAQAMLAQARSFAMGMGFDTAGLDQKMKWLSAAANAAPSLPGATLAGKDQGVDMLAKAKLELRNGQIDAARKLAEAVFAGPYGMQNEAAAVLRACEVENNNKLIASAHQAYDAGMSAFERGEFQQAYSIFLQIDGTLLTRDKKQTMTEKMGEASRLATGRGAPIVRTSMPGDPPPIPGKGVPVPPGAMPPLPVPGSVPGTARASDAPGARINLPASPIGAQPPMGADNYAAQLKALQQVEFQRLRTDGLKIQREAQLRFTRGETDAAIQMLNEHLAKLKDAQLDPTDLAMLQRPVEYRLQNFKVLKSQRDAEVSLASRATQHKKKMADLAEEREQKYKQVAELMKQYNGLMEDRKYAEAEVIAMKAQEMDPESDVITASVNIAKMAKRHAIADKLKSGKEQSVLDGLNDTDDTGKFLTTRDPLDFDKERFQQAASRGRGDRTLNRLKSERERDIERKLSTPVTVDFNNTSLKDTVKYLQQYLKMNIVFNPTEMMKAEGINPEQPVTLKVDAIPLKSALNLLLKQAKLTYVIADDVLQVVTEKEARGKLVQKIYPVADLVIPIDNYTVPNATNILKQLDDHNKRVNAPFSMSTAYQPPQGLNNGQPAGASMTTNPLGSGIGTDGKPLTPGPMASTGNVTLASNTIEHLLIKLVSNTVSPHSWSEVGGSGTIDYYPIGHALVVNQLEDVQEQIADLLDQLRRLQDLEVAIEVRIVSVSESFFERIGMDFSMNIKTDHSTKGIEPQLTSGQFKPAGFLNDPTWKGVIAGLTPAGTLTADLDIPLKSNSFNMSIPPFAYPNSPGGNGGLSLGLAFFNDIQVFMFMEAAQGDRRFNVMQAPKLTAFNGASANISISDFQFFVTDVQVFNVNGQIIFRPVNTPLPIGGQTGSVQLFLQPVVSADRRYVRLNMQPVLSSLSSALVPLFPVTAFITPTFEGGFVGQPIPFTQFVQQPAFNTISVQTTVSVPDGGTVVLGGLKTLNEGRNEFGPPVLSKIPYLNRLFRNTGYGREAQNMLIMVTPRIIINREEAERQVGEPQDALLP